MDAAKRGKLPRIDGALRSSVACCPHSRSSLVLCSSLSVVRSGDGIRSASRARRTHDAAPPPQRVGARQAVRPWRQEPAASARPWRCAAAHADGGPAQVRLWRRRMCVHTRTAAQHRTRSPLTADATLRRIHDADDGGNGRGGDDGGRWEPGGSDDGVRYVPVCATRSEHMHGVRAPVSHPNAWRCVACNAARRCWCRAVQDERC